MLLDDFYSSSSTQSEEQAEVVQVEKIKLGETEYTQDELNKLVGLGRIAQEAEEKYDRPISKFWPEYTKERQRADSLEAELTTYRNKATESTTPGEQTDAQLRQQARQQAEDLGLVTNEKVQEYIRNEIAGQRLIDNINGIVDTVTAEGKPRTSAEDILRYMRDEGVKNPQNAYELMYKDELKTWEKTQLESLKQPRMVTEAASTAGSKSTIPPVSYTPENLGASLKAFLDAQDNGQ